MDFTTITGVVNPIEQGASVAGATLYVHRATKAGENVAILPFSKNPVSGTITIVVPRNSTIYTSGTIEGFWKDSDGNLYTRDNPKALTVPDAATANLEDLVAVAAVPSTGLTLKDEGTALASFIGTLNITGAGASVVQASAGVATLNIPGIGSANFVDLADVTFTGLASGQFPRYNGTAWVNAALLAADIPSLSATYSLTGHNHSGIYQPLDSDLTLIAGLGTASQQLRTNAAADAVEWFTPGASGAAWGDITGTLADQTDLQSALDLKANLTANAFTRKQTITQGTANEGILASTGYSLTGSDTTPMLDLAGTWNTSGTPIGIKLNITNTASNGGLLADFKIGGSTVWSLDASGRHKQINSGSATLKMAEVRGDGSGGVFYEFSRAGGGYLSFGVEPLAGGVIIPGSLPNAVVFRAYDPSNMQFGVNDTIVATMFHATGNMGVGSATDTGQKFQVTGISKFSGHVLAGGTAPTIASGFAASGSSITGADEAGRVTVGGTTPGNTGAIAFNAAYTVAPVVQAQNETTPMVIQCVPTTTGVTFNAFDFAGNAVNFTAGDKISWIARGY